MIKQNEIMILQYHGNHKVTIGISCRSCNKQIVINNVSTHQIKDYLHDGALVQNAFPDMRQEEREMFVSQICEHCWSRIFGDETK